MAENDLITPMMAAYFDVPADALARTIGSENMEAEGVAMARVLAVVREYDASAVRSRIAALEAERDKLRSALTDFVEMGDGYGWGEALTGRQILMANARAALATSDAQEGRADV